jgi:integrase
MKKLHFTKAMIEALPTPTEGAASYADAKTSSLYLRISRTGARTWSVFKWCRAQRRPMRVSLGPYPSVGIDAARRRATEVVAAIDQGRDLQAEKAKRFAIPTLGELSASYRRRLEAMGRRHHGYVASVVRLSFKDWLDRRADNITQREISQRHDEIALSRGRVTAARAVKVMRTLLNHAQLELGLDVKNVARAIRVTDSRPRSRYMTEAEELKLLTVLTAESEDAQDYIRLLMLTGARRDNVAGMRWADVDLTARIWTIPGSDAKAGTAIAVPLVLEAVALLTRRRDSGRSSTFCFPSRGKTGRLVEVWPMFQRLKARAALHDLGLDWRARDPKAVLAKIDPKVAAIRGLGDLTVHDLRRTLAVRLVGSGASLPIIAAALGHRNLKTTQQVYALATQEDVRAAFERVHSE